MAGLFQVLWGQADGSFKQAEALAGTDEEPLVIPPGDYTERYGGTSLENICTRPTAVDWDSDGDLDLVVGNFGGSFYLFSGEGDGRFGPVPQPLLSHGEPLTIEGQHSDPFVVDWDGDGDLDLLSGSSLGGVQWAENNAGATNQPELERFETLIAAGPPMEAGQLLREDDLVGPTTSTRIWVDDVNADGKLDILVGDSTRLVSPAEGLSAQEYQEEYTAWRKEMDEATEELQASMLEEETNEERESEKNAIRSWLGQLFGLGEQASKQEKAQERYIALSQKRSEFVKGDATGFVWLYLQQ